MKKLLQKTVIVLSTAIGLLSEVEGQNVGVNTTGAAPAATNLFEVLQPSTTANTVGVYSEHSGVVGSGTAYGLQAISNGAGVNNVAAYLQAINGTSSNYALIVPSGGGNVGLGTSAPTALLHLTNDGIFISSNDRGIGIGDTPRNENVTTDGGRIYRDNDFFAANVDAMVIEKTDNSDNDPDAGLSGIAFTMKGMDNVRETAMVIIGSKNVGIGTTSPTAKIHVDQDNAATGLYVTGGNGGNILARFERDVGSAEKFDIIPSGGDIFTRYEVNPAGTLWNVGVDDSGDRFAIYTGGSQPAATDEFSIQTDGNVGIGTTTPNAKLQVNGSVNCTGGTCTSDIRWKKNVKELESVLPKLMTLRGVSYYWRQKQFKEKGFNERKQIGVIAQEVEEVFPELIDTDSDGFKSMDYMSFTAVLLQATKEQQAIIEKLENEINISRKNEEYQNQINQELKAEIEEIKAIVNQQTKK